MGEQLGYVVVGNGSEDQRALEAMRPTAETIKMDRKRRVVLKEIERDDG